MVNNKNNKPKEQVEMKESLIHGDNGDQSAVVGLLNTANEIRNVDGNKAEPPVIYLKHKPFPVLEAKPVDSIVNKHADCMACLNDNLYIVDWDEQERKYTIEILSLKVNNDNFCKKPNFTLLFT
jgi:hypothetical protein